MILPDLATNADHQNGLTLLCSQPDAVSLETPARTLARRDPKLPELGQAHASLAAVHQLAGSRRSEMGVLAWLYSCLLALSARHFSLSP